MGVPAMPWAGLEQSPPLAQRARASQDRMAPAADWRDPRPGAQIPEKSLLNLKHLRLAIELRDLEDGLAGYTERGVSMVKRRRDDRRNCGDDTEGRRIATTMQSCG